MVLHDLLRSRRSDLTLGKSPSLRKATKTRGGIGVSDTCSVYESCTVDLRAYPLCSPGDDGRAPLCDTRDGGG